MVKIHVVSGHGVSEREMSDPDASAALPVRKIDVSDLKDALRKGFDDFWAMPTHVVFLVIFYPIIGLFLARIAFGYNLFPLLFPVVSGFAILGPIAALGLYELSRRRERGMPVSVKNATDVLQSPAIRPIVELGLLLAILFVVWVAVAQMLYLVLFGRQGFDSMGAFLSAVLTTKQGWALIVVGNAIGLAFSIVAYCLSVISFPLLLDRHVDGETAIRTSFRAVRENPRTMAIWALIVAAALFIGFVPAMVGLAIVLPVLGHATWHLYRKIVV